MTPGYEAPVSLEKLDAHLKALLRLKIREFVHLSPWFKNVPTVEGSVYGQGIADRPAFYDSQPFSRVADCPHRKRERQTARRHVRPKLHLSVR